MQTPPLLGTEWPNLAASIAASIDLEETARRSGALIRRRGVRSAEALLRLALAYGPGRLSLRSAAAWAGVAGLAALSDTALMNRLRRATAWLGEIAGALLRRRLGEPASKDPLLERPLRIADASMIVAPGGAPTWRLHATYDPVAGRFTSLELTDKHGAEGFGRSHWQTGEVAVGDRCYARPPALRQLLAAGADFIVRTGWMRLRLLGDDGKPLLWDRVLDGLPAGAFAEQTVWIDTSGKGGKLRGKATFPARLIVLRLPPGAAARAAKAQHRRQSRSRADRPMQPMTVRSAGYLMLVTSLPAEVPAAEVLRAYRLRWQVELAFKRLKSLLGFDRLPAKSETLARCWLLAHLVLALLIEDQARDLLGYAPGDQTSHQPNSLWRVTQALRDTLLAAVRGPLCIASLVQAAATLHRHLRERPRRRNAGHLPFGQRHAAR